MRMEELVLEKVRLLSEDKAREVLDFTEWLVQKEIQEEQEDCATAMESLREGGVPIPYEQIRQELGLDK